MKILNAFRFFCYEWCTLANSLLFLEGNEKNNKNNINLHMFTTQTNKIED